MIKSLGDFKDYNDNTIKCVYDVGKNKIIEMSVLYNKKDKDVICVPTHHFCSLGCKMCHLTNKSLDKKMQPIIIDDFMYCIKKTLSKYKTNKKKLLISFMGVGEPLLNLELIENIFKKEYVLINLGYNDVSYALSTMMPNNNIMKLTHIVNKINMPIKVHFSLHNPIDAKRKELIPSTKVSINEALSMLNYYKNTIIKNKKIMQNYQKFHQANDLVEIHYTLIKNVNDSKEELDSLIALLKDYLNTIKFIKFNPINNLENSNNEEKWIELIKNNIPNIRVKSYAPPGRQVGSSCGEFTKHYYHYEIETKTELEEFNKWKKEHEIIN